MIYLVGRVGIEPTTNGLKVLPRASPRRTKDSLDKDLGLLGRALGAVRSGQIGWEW
jgi:hypothetical protein